MHVNHALLQRRRNLANAFCNCCVEETTEPVADVPETSQPPESTEEPEPPKLSVFQKFLNLFSFTKKLSTPPASAPPKEGE